MDTLIYWSDVNYKYYFVIGLLFLCYLIYRLFCSLISDTYYIQTRYNSFEHTWRSIQSNKSIPYNIYCSHCGKLMLSVVGLFCECCAISACKSCRNFVNKSSSCKKIIWPRELPFHHLWVNVDSGRGDADHIDDGLEHYFCCWCQRFRLSKHISSTEECDFQRYKKIIIPPKCVELVKGNVSNIVHLPNDCEPLIIFANRKSGSSRSDEILSLFRGLLNPIQVIDLATTSPESVVRWLPTCCRVLVAGGDGSVAWVLTALSNTDRIKAPVAIIPMGTGNDLSRVLGWGATCNSHLDAHSIIQDVTQATEKPIDRWKIVIRPKKGRLRRLRPERTLYAYNYASIGVDAQVALDFHRARTQFLYKYASRTVNYLAYAFLGASLALDSARCEALEKRLRVITDGQEQALPPLQGLVLLNIPSWGAGVDLWSLGSEENVGEQNISDGKLEVVGISSSFQIARLHCGLAEPYRFTQAANIRIDLEGFSAMQVDGEPWMQCPAYIDITWAGRSLVLFKLETE